MDRAVGWYGGLGRETAGTQCRGAPALAGYGIGAALNITALVSVTGV